MEAIHTGLGHNAVAGSTDTRVSRGSAAEAITLFINAFPLLEACSCLLHATRPTILGRIVWSLPIDELSSPSEAEIQFDWVGH